MKSDQQGFGILEVFFVFFIILAIGGLGWLIHVRHDKSTVPSNSGAKTVLNYSLPLISCNTVRPIIQKQLGRFAGDICYASTIKTTSETFKYVTVDQSEAYQEKLRQEDQKNCTMDCGGITPLLGPSDYIIRSNGRVEAANTTWTSLADTALEALTGCPLPSVDHYQNSGRFVVDNGRVGITFSGNDISLGGRFGSSCKASFNLIAYTSDDKPDIIFRSLAVQYNLKDPSFCASKDLNDSNANGAAQQCYSDQAGMRGQIAMCDKTYFSGTGTDDSECIHAVAQRNRDPSVCRLTFRNDRQQCIDLADAAASYYNGTIATSGL